MGCDIHLKTFIYSKVEKKYVPMSAVLEDCEYSDSLFRPKRRFIPVIDGGRFYDFFGLMGNKFRSWYPELDCFEGNDFPEWMKDMTIYQLIDCGDYHTRRWCYADKFVRALSEYRDALTDPDKWRKLQGSDNDNDELHLSPRTFLNANKFLIKYIDDVIQRVKYIKSGMEELNYVVNPEKIVFVTWMDS